MTLTHDEPLSNIAFNGSNSRSYAKEWYMLRMGYRPLTIESSPDMEECPGECRCEQVGSLLCYLATAGCDLRSSDAYLIHSRAYDLFIGGVNGAG